MKYNLRTTDVQHYLSYKLAAKAQGKLKYTDSLDHSNYLSIYYIFYSSFWCKHLDWSDELKLLNNTLLTSLSYTYLKTINKIKDLVK